MTVSNKDRAGETSSPVKYLENIIEHIPTGIIIIDRSGKVLMMNRWQEKMSQVRREQVIGDFFHEKWERLFEQGIMGDYWKLLEEGTPFQTVVHDVYPQFYDQKISAISRGMPLPDGQGFVLLHDVSPEMQRDRRGMEKLAGDLAESNNFLADLIDSSPNLVITADKKGRIESFNRTAESVFGLSRDEVLGRPLSELFTTPLDMDRYMSVADSSRGVEALCRRKDGSSFPVLMKRRNILGREGRARAVLFILTDISWEKAMEEKLALTEKLAVYSELMAGIAHQLNNPLVGVANFSSLLLNRISPDDPNREMVETINEAAQKCRTLLTTMIKSLREPKSTFHTVDLAETISGAVDAAVREHPSGHQPGLAIDLPNVLPPVRGDSLQLLEAFKNILINAFQAAGESGRVSLKARREAAAGKIKIVIHDTGPGIATEHRQRIFEPFFTTKKNSGGGLGLSFAFRVIKTHGGWIEVDEASGPGASFTITLPVYETDREAPAL